MGEMSLQRQRGGVKFPDICSILKNYCFSELITPHPPGSTGSPHRFGHLPHGEMGKAFIDTLT